MQEDQIQMNESILSVLFLPCFVLGIRIRRSPLGSPPPHCCAQARHLYSLRPRGVTGEISQWLREKGGAAPQDRPRILPLLNVYEGGGSTQLYAAAGAMK